MGNTCTQVINCYVVEVGVPDTGVPGHKQEGHCSPVDIILAMSAMMISEAKKSRGWIVETVCCSEVCEEFTTWNVLQEHVQKPVVVIGPNPGWRKGGREEGGRGREEGRREGGGRERKGREGERGGEEKRGREEGGGGGGKEGRERK